MEPSHTPSDSRLELGFVELSGVIMRVLSEPGETFDYRPMRHFYALPPGAPESPIFASHEKSVPPDIDPRTVAWVPVDMEP